jgi:hypothetical protein
MHHDRAEQVEVAMCANSTPLKRTKSKAMTAEHHDRRIFQPDALNL